MTKCTNCDGTGLAGAGDKPWLHQGAVKTCSVCTGTGHNSEGATEAPSDLGGKPDDVSVPDIDQTDLGAARSVAEGGPKEDGASASETGSQDAAPSTETAPQ